MFHIRCHRVLLFTLTLGFGGSAAAVAQDPAEHQHHMPMADNDAGWVFMQDGVVFALFNHQGGPRGGDEFRVPNWWMGMATKNTGRSQVTFAAMLSLDPATVGERGYREIFQVGEAVDGKPLIDRQHPHDLFMQLAAVWRVGLTDHTGLTVAGGPVGEPALGPVAFMHRASAIENPLAPLGHHTFDSTHIAFGVITAAVDRGPFVWEGSVFNGREPDQDRWDFDFGKLDSVSTRLWYKPSPNWEAQVSTGHLKSPEELEPGNLQRTTASVGWMRSSAGNITGVTLGYGVNDTDHGTRQAMFAEATSRRGLLAGFGRFELLQVESGLLRLGQVPESAGEAKSTLAALTLGGVRDVLRRRGFEGAVGADVTLYGVPRALKNTHGEHPLSFQLFFRLRSPAPMGRMLNMRMSQPMMGHGMSR